MDKVVLHVAFCWECPECGIQNFGVGIPLELTAEQKHELHMEHGLVPGEDGEWSTVPDEVHCPKCDKTFPAQHEHAIEDPN